MGKVKWFGLGILLFLVAAVQPVFAQGVDVVINGQQRGAVMTQGDTLQWQITLAPGATANEQIWVDLNNNNVVDPDSDLALFRFSQTDGQMGDPPDMDGTVNGQIYLQIKAGLAPAHYLMVAAVGAFSDTSDVLVNPMANPAFSVSGTVTVPPGENPANLYVQADSDTGNVFWAALTDSLGNYSIHFDSSAANQKWEIRFEGDPFPQYVHVPHDTTIFLDHNYAGIDFIFQEANTKLAGTVLDALTGAPVTQASVWVHLMNGFDNSYDVQADGSFSIPLSLQSSTVGEIGVGGDRIEGQYLWAQSKKFMVSPGDSLNFPFQLYPADTVIVGQIRINSTEIPQNSFRVFATDTAVGTGSAYSDNLGNFSVRVSSLGHSYWVNLDQDQVDSMAQLGYSLVMNPSYSVGPGQMVNFNFVQGGSISGTVTDENQQPMAGFVVEVGMENGPFGQNSWRDTTDANGAYTIGPLPQGQYIVRVLSQDGMVGEFYQHKYDWGNADFVEVQSGANVGNIDLVVHPGGFIAGSASMGGTPLVGIQVEFQKSSNMGPLYFAEVRTDSMGAYVSPPLVSGDYLVRFHSDSLNLDVYYNNATDPSYADMVHVNAPDTTDHIDLAMQEPGQIAGTVFGVSDTGLVRLKDAFVQIEGLGNWQTFPADMDSGEYHFRSLPPGKYRLMASAPGYQTQWYNGKTQIGLADTVVLNAGDSLVIDFTLQKIEENGLIEGTVRDSASGMGIPGIVVTAHAWIPDEWGGSGDYFRTDTTDAEGHYAIQVRDGRFKVYVDAQGIWTRQYYSHQYFDWGFTDEGGNVTPIDIRNDAHVDSVDFDLNPGGFIAGHVDNGTEPLASVDVQIWDMTHNQIDMVHTDSLGNYVTHALPPGPYFVQFVPQWGYIPQYWDGKSDFWQADTVQVVTSDTTKPIDATLMQQTQVHGRVLSIIGRGVGDIQIVAYDTAGVDTFFTNTDFEGWFTFDRLPPGAYVFQARDPNGVWSSQYWDHVSTADSATVVQVTAGMDIELSFQLRNSLFGRVIINEIMWAGSHRDRMDQWVELRNMSPDSVSISNWVLTIRDSLEGDIFIQLPWGASIPGNGYYLISHYSAEQSQIAVQPNFVNPDLIFHPKHFMVALSTRYPYDAGNVFIDAAGDGGPVFAGDSVRFASMVRNMPPTDGRMPNSWSTATTSHGWDPGSTELGTPGLDNTLPVELADFAASTANGTVTLTWSTASESDNLGFEIQRKTETPNSQWEKVGFVKGQGTSASERVYTFTDSPEEIGTYYYRLKQIDLNGTVTFSEKIKATLEAPKHFALKQNYPNPFNPTTTIPFAVPVKSHVTLAVYNVLGQKVAVLYDAMCKPGVYHVTWDGKDNFGREVGGGMYFIQMKAKGFHQTQKVLLMR